MPGAGLLWSEAGWGSRNQVSDRFDSRSISVLTNALGGRLQSYLLISTRELCEDGNVPSATVSNLQEIALMFHFPWHRIRMKNSELSPHRSNEQRRVNWAPSQTTPLPTILPQSTCWTLGDGKSPLTIVVMENISRETYSLSKH